MGRFKICLYERGDLTLDARELIQIEDAIRHEAQRISHEIQQLADPIGTAHESDSF